jgi:hypothetical protein
VAVIGITVGMENDAAGSAHPAAVKPLVGVVGDRPRNSLAGTANICEFAGSVTPPPGPEFGSQRVTFLLSASPTDN